MKQALISAILGLAGVASAQAQASIDLYNYATPSHGGIVYGANSGGTLGATITSGNYTVGFYYAIGDVAAAVNTAIGGATTTSHSFAASVAASGLTLATGTGATSPLYHDLPGNYYAADALYGFPSLNTTTTVTVLIVAYNGSSYEDSTIRGHSAAFTMPAVVGVPGQRTGNYDSGFAMTTAPEPSTFAIAVLGGLCLLTLRRRQLRTAPSLLTDRD